MEPLLAEPQGEIPMAGRYEGSSRIPSLCCAALLALLLAGAAQAESGRAARQGTMLLGEWVDAVKTDHGKEARRYRLVYEWDTGLTHEYVYAMSGELVSERRYRGAPSPSPDEVEEAAAIVRADPEIAQILRGQPGLSLQGGFPMNQARGEGPCTQRTRCLQMLLFDGDNVVRHLLVDLRTGSIIERDYVPPRNRAERR
jgi:hypothetical protein